MGVYMFGCVCMCWKLEGEGGEGLGHNWNVNLRMAIYADIIFKNEPNINKTWEMKADDNL